MSWENQGRQYHMWFGHGTAGSNDKLPKAGADPLFAAGNVELRIDAVAHGALMHVPRKDWHRFVLSFDRQRLERLRTAMTAWIGARSLSNAAFEAKLVDPLTSNNAIKEFRAAAKGRPNCSDASGFAGSVGTSRSRHGGCRFGQMARVPAGHC